VSLIHEKAKVIAVLVFQTNVHGLDKMVLNHSEIFEVIVDQRFKLALFFKKHTQHQNSLLSHDKLRKRTASSDPAGDRHQLSRQVRAGIRVPNIVSTASGELLSRKKSKRTAIRRLVKLLNQKAS
jgi:hypothetical protein